MLREYSKRSSVALLILFISIPCFAQLEDYQVHRDFYESRGHSIAFTFITDNPHVKKPSIIIIHGSDSATRESGYYVNKAKQFIEIGMSVLLYDKVGIGESSGIFKEMPNLDEASEDVINAVRLIKSQGWSNGTVGLWGISQGGWIGPLAASKSNLIDFVIAVSGPTVTPQEQVIHTREGDLRHDPRFTPEELKLISEYRREVFSYFGTGQGYEELMKTIERDKEKAWFKKIGFKTYQNPPELTYTDSYDFYRYLQFDPSRALRDVKVPILYIYGDHDPLVPIGQCTIILDGLIASGMKNITYQVFKGAGHGIEDIPEGGYNHSGGEQMDHIEMMKYMTYRKAYTDLENNFINAQIK